MKHGKHEHIEHINWIAELKKALLTSFVFLITSTLCFWCIQQLSPGEYAGDKLDRYLLKQITQKIGIPFNEDNISYYKKTNFKASSDAADGIIMCGDYLDRRNAENSGRYVFIFEREQENAWNSLVGTKAKYKIAFSSVCYDTALYREVLVCEDIRVEDLDQNGINEVIIALKSVYADRTANTYIILQKNNGWRMLSPDLTMLEPEISELTGLDVYVSVDEYIFEILDKKPSEKLKFYGQSRGGSIYIVENPFWGGIDILYKIAVNDGTTGLMGTHNSAYVMERYTDHGLFQEPNWNTGKILYVDDYNFDITTSLEDFWGYRLESGIVFYGADVE